MTNDLNIKIKNTPDRALMMAGGTGGHVFPALAIAKRLQEEGTEVAWLGTKQGLEYEIVPKAGIPLYDIKVLSWRREGLLKRILAPFFLLKALLQSLSILRRLKPNFVLSMGGFAAGPGGLAAFILGIPIIVHEQNAVPGATNRILSYLAKQTLEGFPGVFPKTTHAIWTGNPVRQAFLNLPSPKARFQNRKAPLRLLIVGGSQGAIALNALCPKALALIPEHMRPEIWHQAGNAHLQSTLAAYQSAGVLAGAKVEPFIEAMDKAYDWADIVLCRSGALTIAELAAAGVGSILVPFPFAVDDHQTHNGRFLESLGAARLISQKALDPSKLAEIILELGADRPTLLKMAEAARSAAKLDATEKVIEYCRKVSEGH